MESMAYDAILMRLRALYFKEVFHGEQAEMADANRICSTEFKMGAFCVAIFATGTATDAEKILRALQDKCNSAPAQAIYESIVFPMCAEVFIVSNYRHGARGEIEGMLEGVFDSLDSLAISGVAVLAIGSEEDRFEDIVRSYTRAKVCAFARRALATNCIFNCDAMKWPARGMGGALDMGKKYRLSNALRRRARDEIRNATVELLDNIIDRSRKEPLIVLPAFLEVLCVYEANCECVGLSAGADAWRYFQQRRRELEATASFEDAYGVFRRILQDMTATDPDAERAKHAAVLKMQKYIEDNYRHDISLAELAAIVGLNKNYICDLFKNDTGVTIRQYLIAQRMERVKLLLQDSDCTIAEIAQSVGYSDDKYLSAQFKRRYGVAPGEYRKNCLWREDNGR